MTNKYIYEFVGVAICKFIGTRIYFLKGGSGSIQALFTDACVLYISATEFPHKGNTSGVMVVCKPARNNVAYNKGCGSLCTCRQQSMIMINECGDIHIYCAFKNLTSYMIQSKLFLRLV